MIDKSKREFFRQFSLKANKTSSIRPPYNENDDLFYETCPLCENKPCIKNCPENIITLDDKLPALDFSKGFCTFCHDCANACDKGVLIKDNLHKKINLTLIIDKSICLPWNHTICESCRDVCKDSAIDFHNFLWDPVINNKCTSCGACVYICPTKAVVEHNTQA